MSFKPDHVTHHPVVDPGRPEPSGRFPQALRAGRPDDLVARMPLVEQTRDGLRGILQVRGQRDGTLPAGRVQRTGQRDVGAGVPCQPDAPDSIVGTRPDGR